MGKLENSSDRGDFAGYSGRIGLAAHKVGIKRSEIAGRSAATSYFAGYCER